MAFGRCLSNEGIALMNRVNPLKKNKGSREISSPFLHVNTQWESTGYDHAAALILDYQPPEFIQQ